MSFGEGNLHDEVDRLKVVNGKLCDEINRQERVIEEQRRLIANRDESIRNLTALLDKRQERIERLEALVRDTYRAWCFECDPWDGSFACEFFDGSECDIKCRMRELGIEVD